MILSVGLSAQGNACFLFFFFSDRSCLLEDTSTVVFNLGKSVAERYNQRLVTEENQVREREVSSDSRHRRGVMLALWHLLK